MLLGDSVDAITSDMMANGISSFLAIIYVTMFIFLFVLAVNNIMIAIINEEFDKFHEKIE